MGTRRAARELALQALYQLDVAGAGDPAVALFWSHLDAERAEAERESARAARGESRAGFTRGHRKSAGREAPEHWTGPRVGRSRSLPASWSTASPSTASASTRSSRRARSTGGCHASRAWT